MQGTDFAPVQNLSVLTSSQESAHSEHSVGLPGAPGSLLWSQSCGCRLGDRELQPVIHVFPLPCAECGGTQGQQRAEEAGGLTWSQRGQAPVQPQG